MSVDEKLDKKLPIKEQIEKVLSELVGSKTTPTESNNEEGDGIFKGDHLTSNIPVLNFVAQSPIFNACSNNENLVHRYERNGREFIAVGERLSFRAFKLYLAVMQLLNDLRSDKLSVVPRDLFLTAEVSRSNLNKENYVDGLVQDLKKLGQTYFLVYQKDEKGSKSLIYFFKLFNFQDREAQAGVFHIQFYQDMFNAFASEISAKEEGEETENSASEEEKNKYEPSEKEQPNQESDKPVKNSIIERWTAFNHSAFKGISSDYAKHLFAYYLTYTSDESNGFSKNRNSLVQSMGMSSLPIKDQNRYLKMSHEKLQDAGRIKYKVKESKNGNHQYLIRVLKRD